MKTMAFMPFLVDFINTHKYVYTIRKYLYTRQCELVSVEGVGVCKRTLVCRVYDETGLRDFMSFSGFNTTTEWLEAVRHFVKSNEPMFLYKVEVVTSARSFLEACGVIPS